MQTAAKAWRWIVAGWLVLALGGLAADQEGTPFPGVRYVHRHLTQPRELDMHIVLIDLTLPGLRFATTAANGDRDGDTNLETTSTFVQRVGGQIGINGGFFSRGVWETLKGTCDLCSLAVSNGEQVSGWGRGQVVAINIAADNTVSFVHPVASPPTGFQTREGIALTNAIAGNCRLLEAGKLVAKGGNPSYPQTAIGVTADHHLILFVADGRQPAFSAGMTYEEVAKTLLEFGAVDAISFDGGGSATLAMQDSDGQVHVLNRPSDGMERAVGNNLAVILPQPPAKP